MFISYLQKKVRSGTTTNVTGAGTSRTDATTNAANHMDASGVSGVGDVTTNFATHIDVDAYLFGDVTDEMLSSIPDITQHVQDEDETKPKMKKGKAKVKEDNKPKTKRQSGR